MEGKCEGGISNVGRCPRFFSVACELPGMQCSTMPCMPARGLRSKRTQEIQQVLLLARRQAIEVPDDGVGFRARTGMILDDLKQIGSSSVMQEKQALTESPEWRRAELIGSCRPLGNPVR